jgi:predicted MPP superfamily phosphohydrolase
MKGPRPNGERISDKNGFWAASVCLISVAHLHVYLAVGRHLPFAYEAVWLAVGVASVISSYAAHRIAPLRPVLGWMPLNAALHRCGACWNVFVILASCLLFASRAAPAVGRMPLDARFALSCAVSFAVCVYGLVEGSVVRTVQAEIRTKKLPRGRRLRIAHLSDLHIGPFMFFSFADRVARAVKSASPDLVAITGDIVDGPVGDDAGIFPRYAPFADKFGEMADAPLGAWAVPGNHDYYDGFGNSRDFMKRARIKLLRTEKADLGDIVLAGADDMDHKTWSETPRMTKSEELLESLTEAERGKFVVLMRHRPKIEATTVGLFDLQLSGHTHGGQMFPLPSSRHRIPGRPRGLLALGRGAYLCVTNGAGFVGPPMRFFAPAEIVVIDLIGE